MSSSDLSNADRFDKEYPATTPARLRWLEQRLQLDRGQMLRLMGWSDREITRGRALPWPVIVRQDKFEAERVEHVLTRYLSYFEYDVAKARSFPEEFASKVEKGIFHLADQV